MSKIVLLIDELGEHGAQCLMLVSKLFSSPLAILKRRYEEQLPLGEHALFDRHSPEFPMQLITTLDGLDELGCQWRAFQLLDGQEWDSSTTFYQITQTRLRTMIAAREESIAQQREIASLEDDQD